MTTPLLSSSIELGGDARTTIDSMGAGAKSALTADFAAFSRSKAIYDGLTLEGCVIGVSDRWTRKYYGKSVLPPDILVRADVRDVHSDRRLAELNRASSRAVKPRYARGSPTPTACWIEAGLHCRRCSSVHPRPLQRPVRVTRSKGIAGEAHSIPRCNPSLPFGKVYAGPAGELTLQESRVDIESKRTSALALWRYSHDYLRSAHTLCETDLIACDESQVVYHLAAQGIEFALKSHLRARGFTPVDLNARIGHSLLDALQEAIARDLPPPPAEVTRAIRFIAPYHRKDQFRYLSVSYGKFPHLAPLLAAGAWILGQAVETVVTDYFHHHGDGTEMDMHDMRRRLHIDLGVTVSKLMPRKHPAAWS